MCARYYTCSPMSRGAHRLAETAESALHEATCTLVIFCVLSYTSRVHNLVTVLHSCVCY